METLHLLGLWICAAVTSHLDSCVGWKWVYSSHTQCCVAELLEWGMEGWVGSTGWVTLALAHTRVQRKAFPLPQYPPQFAHGLSWDWTLASSWTGWQLIAWLFKQAIRPQILLRDWFINECIRSAVVLSVKHSSFPFRRPKVQNPVLDPHNRACCQCLSAAHNCYDLHSVWFIIAVVILQELIPESCSP